MFAKLVTVASLAASALATVFITSPTAASSFPAGKNATVSWIDDGSAPSLAQFGNATIAVYVGNVNQQTLLQPIATNVNVSKVNAVSFQPNANIGPNGGDYFIRFQSTSNTSTGALEAFSAKFALTGMSGTFNASVQAEIAAASSSASTSSSASPTAGAGSGAAAGVAGGSVTASSGSAAPTSSGSANGAVGNYAGSAVVLVASGLMSVYLAL